MICVVIKGPTLTEAIQQINDAHEYANLIELRLDCFDNCDIHVLKKLRTLFSIPMIFTLRPKSQGGNYTKTEEERLATILELITLCPEYIDIEYNVPDDFVHTISELYPSVKRIISYHDFLHTPIDLDSIFQTMAKKRAHYYKIAVMAQNSIDLMRVLIWAKKTNAKYSNQIIAISMGQYGQVSRILAPCIGSPITYAFGSGELENLLGQIDAKTLVETYNISDLNIDTAIYGLIGDPIDKSPSHSTHNALIKYFGYDAVYVKIPLKVDEIHEFLHLAKEGVFQGLSVTMPLKERVIHLLDVADVNVQNINACNTLHFCNDAIYGYNTDGIGALNAIENKMKVQNKQMILIGAGGAARAIAYEAQRRGAIVTILNRTLENAHEVARDIGCMSGQLQDMKKYYESGGYDILVNCTSHPLPIDSSYILSTALIMDIKNYMEQGDLLEYAKAKSCQTVYGYEMFVEQATGQFAIWYTSMHQRKIKQFLYEKIQRLYSLLS